jgi:hypothetical protein
VSLIALTSTSAVCSKMFKYVYSKSYRYCKNDIEVSHNMLRVCSVVRFLSHNPHASAQSWARLPSTTMTSKNKQLMRSRYSARALWQSQANAPWDVSLSTGCSTGLDNRASRVARNRISFKQTRYPLYQVDKVKALLKLLQTDKFIGSVGLKHNAKYLESALTEEKSSCATEVNSCRKEKIIV